MARKPVKLDPSAGRKPRPEMKPHIITDQGTPRPSPEEPLPTPPAGAERRAQRTVPKGSRRRALLYINAWQRGWGTRR